MSPICIKCHRFFRCKKNDYYFIEASRDSFDIKPGTAEPEKWKPYKVWAGDLWECPGCEAQIISGVGTRSLSVHHEEKFEQIVKQLKADQFQVNDC